MINAIIIDDEPDSIETLKWKIENYCPEVSLLATFNDPTAGLSWLKKHSLDLLFLDIEMPRLNGFDVLQELKQIAVSKLHIVGEDRTAHGPALAVGVFGRGIDHHVGPQLNGALQQRRCEHVVHDDRGAYFVGHFGHRRDVDQVQLRVRRGLHEDSLGGN